jgi:L-2-hydroxyglutarate oxidase
MKKTDFLIIGAGVIGLTIALGLKKRYPKLDVLIIDKEKHSSEHASGRNSGVLHSGIYYPSDSLKAKFTKSGNLSWKEYCYDNNLKIENSKKLIIARSESDFKVLDLLATRAKKNFVEAYILDEKETIKVEKKVKFFERSLFVPSTASIDPIEASRSLEKNFISMGGRISFQDEFINIEKNHVIKTRKSMISAGFVINCAGLYADKIAKKFGFSENFTLVPFKGLYVYSKEKHSLPNVHIYTAPDLSKPFLGVHFTRTVDGFGKIGPTSMPAFWRENYRGFTGFNFPEFLNVSKNILSLFVNNKNNFRKLAFDEIRKQTISSLVSEANSFLPSIEQMKFENWGKPGIRAQLIDLKEKSLIMDFVIEGDNNSVHILNAISPAFTCAIPFADYVIDNHII